MRIIYEGVDIYPEISVNLCYHDMYASDHCDELLLRMNDTRRLWDVWSPQTGDEIIVSEGHATTGRMFVSGVIPESGFVSLRACSIPPGAKTKKSKAWERVRFLQLCGEVAGRLGLTLETYGVTDHSYGYVAQANRSDLAFLAERARLESAGMIVYDGRLIVYDEPVLEAGNPAKTITVKEDVDFEYRENAARAYDMAVITNGSYTGQWRAGTGDRILKKSLPLKIESQPEATRFARGLLRGANKNGVTGILPAGKLITDIAPGSVVTLETPGAASWDGPAFVSRLRHEYAGRQSRVFFRKPLEGY